MTHFCGDAKKHIPVPVPQPKASTPKMTYLHCKSCDAPYVSLVGKKRKLFHLRR